MQRLGHTVDDHGTHSEESVDYPPICIAVARAVAEGRADRGIVLGGSGQGEQIAANKVPGIRAALCNDLYTARLSREHNDANVLSMGGRIVAFGLADEIVALWLKTRRSTAAATSGGSIRFRADGAAKGMPHMARPPASPSGARSPTPTPRSPPRSATSGSGRTTASS